MPFCPPVALLLLGLLVTDRIAAQTPAPAVYDAKAAEAHAQMALACVHKEFPNKISHVLNGPDDVAAPSELTPSFFGCFDWHSAVHGHWLLARILRRFPDVASAARLRDALRTSLITERLAAELAYLQAPGRATFERPYGLAWLLQLAAELRAWDDPLGRELAAAIAPLEAECAVRLRAWLPKLSHPIRTGEHSQSAFAMGLIRDWAVVARDDAMVQLVDSRARAFHGEDRDWPMRFEPSGQDFLSPGLAVADLMRRVLPPTEFAQWLGGYLSEIPLDGSADWLPVAVVTDRTDGKLAHLDGLNLSRAWMLDGIAAALDADDARRAALVACARAHREAGLRAVLDAPYEGSHWLGTFAVYLATGRGLSATR
ncbi:MAG: hypothetical protein RL398_551 [Planctomycetota bacterium]